MPSPRQGSGNCFKLGRVGLGGVAGLAGEPAYSLFTGVGAPEAKVTRCWQHLWPGPGLLLRELVGPRRSLRRPL